MKHIPFRVHRRTANCEDTYDYVIVGAGSAGCIVASKLAQALPFKTILLIEAGSALSDNNEDIWDPTRWPFVSADDNLEWHYRSTKQEFLNNRKIDLGRAKGLGGCSFHNGMVYVRGGRKGFDHWKEEGNDGWDYDSVAPYFKEVEQIMPVEICKTNDFINSLIAACQKENIPYNPNFNERTDEVCVSPFQYNISCNESGEYRRETTHTTFLNETPKNLCVLTGHIVEKVVLDSKIAKGVILGNRCSIGEKTKIYANDEVILCAGAIGSPQILMLSGVGPEADLKQVEIKSIIDLPGVGQNLQDDLYVPARFKNTRIMPKQPYPLLGAVIFENTTLNDAKLGTDIECSLQVGTAPYMELPDDEKQDWFIYPNLQLMKSRGTVTLSSDDPFDHPVIDPKYLSGDGDMGRCLSGLKLAIRIGKNSELNNWVEGMVSPLPEENLEEYIRKTADTTYHYAGTCKMGPIKDKMAVVSSQLKVHGISKLRVIDASIIPTTVSGNTAAATMMIAMKGSEMIIKGM